MEPSVIRRLLVIASVANGTSAQLALRLLQRMAVGDAGVRSFLRKEVERALPLYRPAVVLALSSVVEEHPALRSFVVGLVAHPEQFTAAAACRALTTQAGVSRVRR